MSTKVFLKVVLLSVFAILLIFFYSSDYTNYFDLSYFKSNNDYLLKYVSENFIQSMFYFSLVYFFTVLFFLPFSVFLSVISGYLFGFWYGLLLASFVSTIAATFSLLISRYFFRGYLEKKFFHLLGRINDGLNEYKSYQYLIFLRVNPIFPFWLINILLGITQVSVFKFYITTQIGALLWTALYVNIGRSLLSIDSLSHIITLDILFSLVLLSLTPFLVDYLLKRYRLYKLYYGFHKPKRADYDLIVIGAGSGGLISAYTGAFTQAKVALIEQKKMGGDCLNEGCIPSKSLIKAASFIQGYKQARHYNILPAVDYDLKYSGVSNYIKDSIAMISPKDSKERYEKEIGVENVIFGKAKIINPFEVSINKDDKQYTISANKIIIASGASPFIPEIKNINSIVPLTSKNIWTIKKVPKKMVVVGGGAIAIEIATAFSNLGSKIYLIERGSRILRKSEPEVSSLITDHLTSKGIEVFVKTSINEIKKEGSIKKVITNNAKEIVFDEIFFALGRKPNIEDLFDSNMNVNKTKKGSIKVNKYLQTNYPNIYACGDVSTEYQFTHIASYEGKIAAQNALFGFIKKTPVKYDIVPSVIYGDYEIAQVGLSEEQVKEKKINYDIIFEYIHNEDRLVTSREKGFVKLIVNKENNKILGGTIVCSRAGEMIHSIALCIHKGLKIKDLYNIIFAYPTFSEVIKNSVGKYKMSSLDVRVFSIFRLLHKVRRIIS